MPTIFLNGCYLLGHGHGDAATVVTVTDQFVITEAAVGDSQTVHRRDAFEAEAVLVSTFPYPYLNGVRRSDGARLAPTTPAAHPAIAPGGWTIDLRLVPESAYVRGYQPE